MEICEEVYEFLNELNVDYEIINHPAVYTSEEADKYVKNLEVSPVKNLFLCNNKKSKFFLILMDDKKTLNIKNLSSLVGEKRLKFASEETLYNKLGVKAGSVSIFGLLNNIDRDIEVFIDEDIINNKKLTFHPNDNTKTLLISSQDTFKVLNKLNYSFKLISL